MNITSNLAFRQVFSDNIQQAISPEERSQVFVNKNHNEYSFNFLARIAGHVAAERADSYSRVAEHQHRQARPSPLRFLKKLPVYFSFESGAEGVSRKETVEDLVAVSERRRWRSDYSRLRSCSVSIFIRVSVAADFWRLVVDGFGRRARDVYSNSIRSDDRGWSAADITRGYGEFELDVRPPALRKIFIAATAQFFFRHVIEPYITYRRIAGINNFRSHHSV